MGRRQRDEPRRTAHPPHSKQQESYRECVPDYMNGAKPRSQLITKVVTAGVAGSHDSCKLPLQCETTSYCRPEMAHAAWQLTAPARPSCPILRSRETVRLAGADFSAAFFSRPIGR